MKVSVCVTTRNGERFVVDQLTSILDQLGPGDEVIVSDDRSTDRTLELVAGLGDGRVRVLLHPEVADNPYDGPSRTIYAVYKNVENALTAATGDVVFLADQDDVWLPRKVARVLEEFAAGAELVLHDNVVVGESSVLMESYFAWSRPSRSWARFVVRCFYQGAAMAFSRRVLELALPFPRLALSHDHWIAAVGWTHGRRITFVRHPLMIYRRHGANVSPSGERSRNPLGFKIGYRFSMVLAIWLAFWRGRLR